MDWKEVEEMARSVGWPATVVFIVALVLIKNGWWKLIIRGERDEEISNMRNDLTALESSYNVVKESVEELEEQHETLNKQVQELTVLTGRLDERTRK